MEPIKEKFPSELEFNNSGGRLIALLGMLKSNTNYFENTATFYLGSKDDADFKGRSFTTFMSLLQKTYDEFMADVTSSNNMPQVTKDIIFNGIVNIPKIVFPVLPDGPVKDVSDAEYSLLRMAASMLEMENDLTTDDVHTIRDSIESLRQTLEDSELSKSARVALLELVNLTRNALEQYNIHGARGFKKAFKRMLAELMEVYLREGNEVKDQAWWNEAMQHIQIVDKVASKLLEYKPLLESVSTLFIGNA